MTLTKEQKARLYNPDAMEEYLTDREREGKSSLQPLQRLTYASEKIEKTLRKNFWEMSPKEYEDNILNLNILKIQTIRYDVTFINDYNLWAFKKGHSKNYFKLTDIIDFRKIDYSDIIRRQIIKCEDDFKSFLNANIESSVITNEDICSLLCWIGISSNEIGEVRESDVIPSENKIVYKNKTIEMSSEFMEIIKSYMGADFIKSEKMKRTAYKNKSPYLVKFTFPTESKAEEYNEKPYGKTNISVSLRSFLRVINIRNEKEYSMESLCLSGEYHRLRQCRDEEAVINQIKELYPAARVTYITDYKIGYDQYIKTYWS